MADSLEEECRRLLMLEFLRARAVRFQGLSGGADFVPETIAEDARKFADAFKKEHSRG